MNVIATLQPIDFKVAATVKVKVKVSQMFRKCVKLSNMQTTFVIAGRDLSSMLLLYIVIFIHDTMVEKKKTKYHIYLYAQQHWSWSIRIFLINTINASNKHGKRRHTINTYIHTIHRRLLLHDRLTIHKPVLSATANLAPRTIAGCCHLTNLMTQYYCWSIVKAS